VANKRTHYDLTNPSCLRRVCFTNYVWSPQLKIPVTPMLSISYLGCLTQDRNGLLLLIVRGIPRITGWRPPRLTLW